MDVYNVVSVGLDNTTIRLNILFGQPEDKGRYDTVLECCELMSGLAELASRDDTELGSHGPQLSEAFKAR